MYAYSFLNLEIQRSQYIRPKVTVHKGAETIQGRKLFKGGNYMRKYGIHCRDVFGTGAMGALEPAILNHFVSLYTVLLRREHTEFRHIVSALE